MTNAMLTTVCEAAGRRVGYARALVDGVWRTLSALPVSAEDGELTLDFGLDIPGRVTRVELYGSRGELWDARDEDFTVDTANAQGAAYRLRYGMEIGE